MKNILLIIVLVFGGVLIFNMTSSDSKLKPVQTIPIESNRDIGEEGTDALPDILEGNEQASDNVRVPDRAICLGEFCDGSGSGEDNFTVVQIPVITSQGDIGCGSGIAFAPHVVQPKTLGVLNATYETLFDLKAQSDIEADNIRNVVGMEDKLFYKNVSLKDGVATLQLEGLVYNIAHCAIPEFQAQIEQSALQFDTVNSLRVYLNTEPWDWCEYSDADPSEDGCDLNPKHWIVSK